jgi:hypothetical protein
MKKLFLTIVLALPLMFTNTGCETLEGIAKEAMSEPTLDEIGRGLKEALTNGISKGVDVLSARDGYFNSPYKILLPAEARKVTDRLRVIPGFEKLEDNLVERINRGAEDAAKEAKPIFVNAIRSMSFQDAKGILLGEDNAATMFLQRTTTEQLYEKFNPKIVASLDKVGANELWKKAIDAYNKIPLVTKINNDLDDYITREALKGLFAKVQDEEKNIRRNPGARSTALLKKVFSRQDSTRK